MSLELHELLSSVLTPFFLALLVSTGMGLLMGLEREYDADKNGESFAGIRTFPIVAIAGTLVGTLADHFGTWAVASGLAGFLVMLGAAYMSRVRNHPAGLTTSASLFVAFVLGIMVSLHMIREALGAAVITVLLLSMKERFHALVARITQVELFAVVKFAILSLLLLPFLPDRDMGSGGVLNLQQVGWAVIVVSGLSFIGYWLNKFYDANKGVLLTAFFGGLFSSTAVAWSFAAKSRASQELSRLYAA